MCINGSKPLLPLSACDEESKNQSNFIIWGQKTFCEPLLYCIARMKEWLRQEGQGNERRKVKEKGTKSSLHVQCSIAILHICKYTMQIFPINLNMSHTVLISNLAGE